MNPTKPLLALLLATTIAACSDNDKKDTKPVDGGGDAQPVDPVTPVEPEKDEPRAVIAPYKDPTPLDGDGNPDPSLDYSNVYGFGALSKAHDGKRPPVNNLPTTGKNAEYKGYAEFNSGNQKLDSKLTLNANLALKKPTVSGSLSDFRNLSGRQALDGTLDVQEFTIENPSTSTEFASKVEGKIDGKEFGMFEFDGTLAGDFFDGNDTASGGGGGTVAAAGEEGRYIFGTYDPTKVTTVRGGKSTTTTKGNIDGGKFAAEFVPAKK